MKLTGGVSVESEHPHVEGGGTRDDRAPDGPRPNDTDHLPSELETRRPAPLVGTDASVCLDDVACIRQEEGVHVLGDGRMIDPRTIRDDDTARAGRIQIDLVGARAVFRDGSETILRRRLDYRAREIIVPANHAITTAQERSQGLGGQWTAPRDDLIPTGP
jgi:hypothetical protein